MARDPPPPSPRARHSERWRSRTHSACEKSVRFPIPINTDHLFIITLLIPKPKCESPWCSVAYYRCILLPNVLSIRTPRGQAVMCANYRCTHLNECTSYQSTSFACRIRPFWIHLKFDSTIKVRYYYTPPWRAFQTRWHQCHKHTTTLIKLLEIS